jgi:ABC-2 type transport system ATP-binding protein
VLRVDGLRKAFARTVAVDGIALTVRRGEIFGFVGPNGAGKTTTLSMMTGLLRPDEGSVVVGDADVWGSPGEAKRVIGVLPDRMRLFDRLTGAQMLYYCGVLHGLDRETARSRSDDLSRALALEGALDRPVADYSIGMIKKVSLAAALIHSPRLLVLDEPFEGVDPVSTAHAIDLLRSYARAGGTVVLSSHNMDLVERVCDAVAVIVGGSILAEGSLDEVRQGSTLEERFVELAGGRSAVEGLEWLTTFSD